MSEHVRIRETEVGKHDAHRAFPVRVHVCLDDICCHVGEHHAGEAVRRSVWLRIYIRVVLISVWFQPICLLLFDHQPTRVRHRAKRTTASEVSAEA